MLVFLNPTKIQVSPIHVPASLYRTHRDHSETVIGSIVFTLLGVFVALYFLQGGL